MSHKGHEAYLESVREAQEEQKSLSTMCRELDELLNTSANIFDKKSVTRFWKRKKGGEVL